MLQKLAWLGTTTSIIGSFLVALGYMKYGYLFFVVGSFSWLIVAAVKRDKPLAILNCTFFIANLIGIYNFVLGA